MGGPCVLRPTPVGAWDAPSKTKFVNANAEEKVKLFTKASKRSGHTSKVWVLLYVYDVSKSLYTEVVESCIGQAMVNAL